MIRMPLAGVNGQLSVLLRPADIKTNRTIAPAKNKAKMLEFDRQSTIDVLRHCQIEALERSNRQALEI